MKTKQIKTTPEYWQLEQRVKYSKIALKQAITDGKGGLNLYLNDYDDKKAELAAAMPPETMDEICLWKPAYHSQLENEMANPNTGIDSTASFRIKGCDHCDGYNTFCLSYVVEELEVV